MGVRVLARGVEGGHLVGAQGVADGCHASRCGHGTVDGRHDLPVPPVARR